MRSFVGTGDDTRMSWKPRSILKRMKELWQIFWFLRFIKGKLTNMTAPWSEGLIATEYKEHKPNVAQIFAQAESAKFIEPRVGEYTNSGRLYVLTPKGRKLMYFPLGTLEVMLDEFPRALPYVLTLVSIFVGFLGLHHHHIVRWYHDIVTWIK